MKKYFTYKDDKSDKFWSVEVNGTSITVVYGKTGTAGVTNTKDFSDEADAIKEMQKLINEKTKKGYKERTGKKAGKFGETEFWGLIERAKNKTEDTYEQMELLIELLTERSEEDIIEFEKIFLQLHASSYQSKLWAAAYIIKGGCSDDGFDYFRGWLIAQGEDVFYKALENPESLARIIKVEDADEVECEDMLSVGGTAYENKTGKDYEEIYKHIPSNHVVHPEMNLDWEEEGDDLKNMFPKLWKKFAE